MTWNWYLSIAAIRGYMQIMGLAGPLEAGNPDFERAERDLGEYSLTARLVGTRPDGITVYRTGKVVTGKPDKRGYGGVKHRLEFEVAPGEGKLPALLYVRRK